MHKSCKNDIPASKIVLFFFHRWFFPFTLNSICAIKLTSHKFIYITCIYGEGMMWLLVMSILKSFVWHYNNPILLYIYPTRHVLYPYDIFFPSRKFFPCCCHHRRRSQRWENMMKASVHRLNERKGFIYNAEYKQ